MGGRGLGGHVTLVAIEAMAVAIYLYYKEYLVNPRCL